MTTIHITGASGFLGSNLCRHFLKNGFQVNAIVRQGSLKKITGFFGENFKTTIIDLEKLDQLSFTLEKDDYVIHTASIDPAINEFVIEDLLDVNISLALKLMIMCAKSESRFLNIGTNWQHYKNRDYSPVSLYAASKEAHQVFQKYFIEVEELDAKTIELCDTYGTNDPRNKLLPLLMNYELNAPEIELTDGHQLVDYLHIDDVVRAIDKIIENWDSNIDPDRMSLTSNKLITVRKLVELCNSVRKGKIPVSFGKVKPRNKRQMEESWAKYPTPKGWHASITLVTGLKELNFQNN